LTSDLPKSDQSSAAIFVTTQWTRVLEARGESPEARAALSDLCEAYYAPVFAFVRCSTRDEESARDLTQEFFARILSGQSISGVDRSRGRFRSFLLGAVKHFLSDMREYGGRKKRGGGQVHEPIDSGTYTSLELQLADLTVLSPDREFDRKWALTLLDRALAALASEHQAAGKIEQFEILKPWLTGDTENLSQSDAARQIGSNEGAVKVAIHRLRRRFREVLKIEISQTVHDRAEVGDELRNLLLALG
jgi:RNA polymerase sigma factor (sigma-70 family)